MVQLKTLKLPFPSQIKGQKKASRAIRRQRKEDERSSEELKLSDNQENLTNVKNVVNYLEGRETLKCT